MEALCKKERDLDDMRYAKKGLERQLDEQREITNQLQNKMNAVSGCYLYFLDSTWEHFLYQSRLIK